MFIDISTPEELRDYWFEGYIYGKRTEEYRDYLLNGYRTKGITFIQEINGIFCGYIKDLPNDRVIIFNDRYGTKDLFCFETGGKIIMSSEFNELVKRIPKKTIDEIGVMEFLTFQYPLYEKTFVEEIRLLPGGTILVVDLKPPRSLKAIRYWDYKYRYKME